MGDVVKAPVKTGMVQEVKALGRVRASNPLLRQAQHRFGLKLCVATTRDGVVNRKQSGAQAQY